MDYMVVCILPPSFFCKTEPFPWSKEVQKLTANQNLRRRSIFQKKEIAVKTNVIVSQ